MISRTVPEAAEFADDPPLPLMNGVAKIFTHYDGYRRAANADEADAQDADRNAGEFAGAHAHVGEGGGGEVHQVVQLKVRPNGSVASAMEAGFEGIHYQLHGPHRMVSTTGGRVDLELAQRAIALELGFVVHLVCRRFVRK